MKRYTRAMIARAFAVAWVVVEAETAALFMAARLADRWTQ